MPLKKALKKKKSGIRNHFESAALALASWIDNEQGERILSRNALALDFGVVSEDARRTFHFVQLESTVWPKNHKIRRIPAASVGNFELQRFKPEVDDTAMSIP